MLLVRAAHLQIVWRVVLAIEVLVMHFFAVAQRTANGRFGYYEVLENVALRVRSRVGRDQDFPVALFDDERLFPVRAGTCRRAIFCSVVLRMKCAATVQTLLRRATRMCRWFLRWRIGQRQIVPTTKAFRFGCGIAPIGGARALCLDRSARSAALPHAIATRIAEWVNRAGVNLLCDGRSAVRAVLCIHAASIHYFGDTPHFSIEHEGVK